MSNSMRMAALGAALCVAGTAGLEAQVPALEPGTRIRLTASRIVTPEGVTVPRGRNPMDCIVARRSADSLWVVATTANRPMAVAIPDIERLRVYRGSRRRAGTGAWIGAAAGTLSGLALVGTLCAGDTFTCSDSSAFAFTLLSSATGAFWGSLIGWALRSDRWEDVSRSALQVSLSPRDRGFTVAVRRHLRF